MTVKTAKQLGLGLCPNCHKLNHDTKGEITCSRCGSLFYQRKYKSLEFTIAWLCAAIVMLVPANTIPIMVVSTLGNSSGSTILEGIIEFMEMGSYAVAAIIFFASFIVPLSKIAGIIILVLGVYKGSDLEPKQRSFLYRLVEFLGPWSMLDVFVVTLMVAIVNLGFLINIEAAPGANYFALVVIFTMFSAECFDPRLLWDSHKDE